ncbi:hypothetical protein Y032_0017g3317 [Ancylostoma ceylanicum]|uniref:Uncharacterized protein n=1 Tax=Ancylostoma ceylanicum TaxID=53326 RepID=A0A016V5T6_9BILA|nr:hypothetical protein Y032_0017g3317 [Ancylostoma ceylanicum]
MSSSSLTSKFSQISNMKTSAGAAFKDSTHAQKLRIFHEILLWRNEPTRMRSIAAALCARGGAADLRHGKILIDAISVDKYRQCPPRAIPARTHVWCVHTVLTRHR